jgi:hypothetical protein
LTAGEDGEAVKAVVVEAVTDCETVLEVTGL